jgi:aconitate hydratase
MAANNTFNTYAQFEHLGQSYHYHSLPALEKAGLKGLHRLPYALKILLENLLRHENGSSIAPEHIRAFEHWLATTKAGPEIAYHPARVLMQDFTGVPAVVDLAAMRNAVVNLGTDAKRINPLCPVDLVIDHSVQVDYYGDEDAMRQNVEREMQRNQERYQFLRWGQKAFEHFRVVPPGTGICHQVNLEYLAKVAWTRSIDNQNWIYPDTLVGTDSHTTMINGLGVLGWGVGGIEAEAAMLGQPISMLIPEVVGFEFTGQLQSGITATDLVLRVVQMLREHGVVGKFVEFFGEGLRHLSLADRATIANMAPEYGATCGLFPIDQETLNYLQLSGRDEAHISLVKAYAQAQGMWVDAHSEEAAYSSRLILDLASIEPSVAGPKRPQDRVAIKDLKQATEAVIEQSGKQDFIDTGFTCEAGFDLHHGDVMIAAITSCTNTSNPAVLLAAGLLAKKACELGLVTKPWVKTSLAPGSKVVTDYLKKSGLLPYLEKLGFYVVGYGCTTCIGNSGPLQPEIEATIQAEDLVACGVLSGNRNFEGRIHPFVKANWLASPPLVVAYALAGTTRINLSDEALANDADGNPVYLKDLWPSNARIQEAMHSVTREQFQKEYAKVFDGDEAWQSLAIPQSKTYDWNDQSTYVQHPPFFEGMTKDVPATHNIEKASVLALLGDSITTDHISPAGTIKADSPAGRYLKEHDVALKDFNSYGARRGNHEVMMRGTFANIRIRNEMVPGIEGGFTKHIPTGDTLPIYDAAMRYVEAGTPTVVVAGKEYGTGSSRDWAAKGTRLLGVRAVIAESFERIHRSNLIGMGVLPLKFQAGTDRKSLKLDGSETISISGIDQGVTPSMTCQMKITRSNGEHENVPLLCRIETSNEASYFQNEGILQYVMRQMVGEKN